MIFGIGRKEKLLVLDGRYEITKPLKEGGFGITYLAKDTRLPNQPTCVVKKLKSIAKEPKSFEVAKRFFDEEATSLYRLGSHDQIPTLLAHFEEKRDFYLVQQYIEGKELTEELSPKKYYDQKLALKLLEDILEVLEFVHEENVIHRDIKPANLLRRKKDNKIVLIDFGAVKNVSHISSDGISQTSKTVAVGTLGYIAKEQRSGYPKFSSDIYAVGIICLQALTGLIPMNGKSLNEEFPIDRETEEISIDKLQKYCTLEPAFVEILRKMVHPEYTSRFRDAREALYEIRTLKSATLNSIGITSNDKFPTKAFRMPEGPIAIASDHYIHRPPIETDCYHEILKPGALIHVKSPKQMGKTSLIMRTLDQANKAKITNVYLPFQLLDDDGKKDLGTFFKWLCSSLARKLSVEDRADMYWQDHLGSKDNCNNYFEDKLLPKASGDIILAFDDVDIVFNNPVIFNGFSSLLRAWHEQSKCNPLWEKVKFIISYSKEPSFKIDLHHSPFNVGVEMQLSQFEISQINSLVNYYKLNLSDIQINDLILMFGGHPYLTSIALYSIANGRMSLDDIVDINPLEKNPFSTHLQGHLIDLNRDTRAKEAMKLVTQSEKPVLLEMEVAVKLKNQGLIKYIGGSVIPSCELYRKYFLGS